MAKDFVYQGRRIGVVGAGFSGTVLARALAQAGFLVTLHEARAHIGGNCHTERCPRIGVMVHVYGPHIFHTNDAEVWDYANRFARFRPYCHRVKASLGGRIFSMPINLHTINQFFGTAFSPAEAERFVAEQTIRTGGAPENLEEQALSMMGPALYEAFFKGYTQKQWGCAPATLPASILTRLPLRFSYEDNYFFHSFQGIPEDGYTKLIARILDHPNIDVHLNSPATRGMAQRYDHLFWTGPLDAYFGHSHGRLGYRTLDFDRFETRGDGQGCAVMNYPEPHLPHTRVTEHKHFAPWEQHENSVLYRETPRACGVGDIPYYPIRLTTEKALLSTYECLALAEENVRFLGRLGTYRYLDMDVTIREALNAASTFLQQGMAASPLKGVA
jgi:UDP-galactopyranose mutase